MLKNNFLFHTGLQVTWFFDVDWGVLLLWFRCNYFIVIFNNFSITLKRNDPTYLFSQRLFICQPATDIHNEPVVWKKSRHYFIDLIFTINTQISWLKKNASTIIKKKLACSSYFPTTELTTKFESKIIILDWNSALWIRNNKA